MSILDDYRSIDYHKKINLKKKQMGSSNDLVLDPLQSLWKMLDDQDDELIFQDTCQIEKPSPVLYDYAPEVHTTAKYMEKVLPACHYNFAICLQKYQLMSSFMRMKIDKNRAQDEQKRYCLTNSIIPAIQGHIQIVMNIPYSQRAMLLGSALSYTVVYETLQNSCRHVQNWTIGQDFGPF
jgi:hypothetical protein